MNALIIVLTVLAGGAGAVSGAYLANKFIERLEAFKRPRPAQH
jgi:uncharacterized protein YneF (UPF0154 family)